MYIFNFGLIPGKRMGFKLIKVISSKTYDKEYRQNRNVHARAGVHMKGTKMKIYLLFNINVGVIRASLPGS